MSQNISTRRWPMAVAAVLLGFFLLSLEPVHKLKESPPPAFRNVRVPAGVDQLRWSMLYWERARLLQGNYVFGMQLPEEPAPSFRISEEETVPESVAGEARRAYWASLRSLWTTPTAWKVSYAVSFSWITRGIEKAGEKSVDFAKGIWHSIRN